MGVGEGNVQVLWYTLTSRNHGVQQMKETLPCYIHSAYFCLYDNSHFILRHL